MASNIVYANKISTTNLAKVIEVSERLGIHPNWLMAVINFETGGKFSPSTTNNIGSVGLIQFTRDKAGVEYKTIQGTKYLLSSLKKMTFAQQMEVVYLYLEPYAKKIHSFIDLYLCVFFPNAIGKKMDYVFETKGLSASLIAKQNPVFNANKDGKITKGEVLEFFRKRYKEFEQINIAVNPQGTINYKGLLMEIAGVLGLVFYVALSF